MNAEKEIIHCDSLLRDEWFNSYGQADIDFIYDGATDPFRWITSRWRIMCLLKEAHGGGIWNHAEEIKNCNGLLRVGGSANQAVHYRMVEWLYAIESTLEQKSIDVENDRSQNYPGARETMLRSAWVNIKKADGVPYSNNNNLHQVIKRDAPFLRRQIEMLNPRLILCGKTFDIVKDELFQGCERIPNTEFSYHQDGRRIILDYIHPGRKARDSYKLLIEEVKRIRQAGMLQL
jgi:hypothetical protein